MEAELRRRRVARKRTLGQRIRKALEMPQLSRAQRNQRVVIVTMVFMLGIYLLVWPVLSGLFSGGSQDGSPSAPAPNNLSKKK